MSGKRLAVILPGKLAPDDDWGEITLLEYERWDGARAALYGTYDGAVLVSDGIPADRFPLMAAAVRECGYPVVEVRSARWDGVEHSTLSAACRGVISGFGVSGVAAALAVLRSG